MMDSHFTQHSVALAVLSITSILVGYTVGKSLRPPPPVASEAEVNGISEDTSEPTDGDLSAITAGILEPCLGGANGPQDTGRGQNSGVVSAPASRRIPPSSPATDAGKSSLDRPRFPAKQADSRQATLACYKSLSKSNPKVRLPSLLRWSSSHPTQLVKHWERTGQAKIALKGTSEKQIRDLDLAAKAINLCSRIVEDSDLKTSAVLAIGPAPVAIVNQVTGKLRLL
ncbi:unnamed protein product [Mycena citricolor]|uniref:peptidyl-tRNA hydrolase n=1 Tax=Mycena citricolor TaxID=2018698 RepID=A0AAD2K5D2_9AGAR|nr:unnamed protein product [Mycena citricolor]